MQGLRSPHRHQRDRPGPGPGDLPVTRRYAAGTDVSTNRSRDEIERTLRRYGADQFAYGWEGGRSIIQFRADNRSVRFELPLPDRFSPEFMLTPSKKYKRSEADAEKAWEQACRQAWRALALVVKAKLEAVEAGIAEFEEEFLAYIVLPNGQTVGVTAIPAVATAYETGKMAPMLPPPKS